MTFIETVINGQAKAGDIDDWVHRWHNSNNTEKVGGGTLKEYLGMTHREYGLWVQQPSALEMIIYKHRKGIK